MNRPLHDPRDAKGTDESTDTYDTVDWLHQERPEQQRPRRRVRRVVSRVSRDDGRHQPASRGQGDLAAGADDRHLDGRRLLPPGRVPAVVRLRVRERPRAEQGSVDSARRSSRWDTYDWYLGARAAGERRREVSSTDASRPGRRSRSIRRYDAYWQARAVERGLKAPTVPTLTVGGWWDQEDRWGPLATYKALEPGDTKHWNFLVMGPWNHGGWRNEARAMAVVDPGTSDAYLRDVEAPWFAYWLQDKGS